MMVIVMGGGKESEDMVGVGRLAKSRGGHTIYGHGIRLVEVVMMIVIVIVMVMTRMTLSWLRVGKGIGTGFAITPLPSKHLLLPDHHHLSHLHLQYLHQLHLLLLLH